MQQYRRYRTSQRELRSVMLTTSHCLSIPCFSGHVSPKPNIRSSSRQSVKFFSWLSSLLLLLYNKCEFNWLKKLVASVTNRPTDRLTDHCRDIVILLLIIKCHERDNLIITDGAIRRPFWKRFARAKGVGGKIKQPRLQTGFASYPITGGKYWKKNKKKKKTFKSKLGSWSGTQSMSYLADINFTALLSIEFIGYKGRKVTPLWKTNTRLISHHIRQQVIKRSWACYDYGRVQCMSNECYVFYTTWYM